MNSILFLILLPLTQGETNAPVYPGYMKGSAAFSGFLDLRWARTSGAPLQQLAADAAEKKAKAHELLAVMRPKVFAVRMRSKTVTGCSFSDVREDQGEIHVAGILGRLIGRNKDVVEFPLHLVFRPKPAVAERLIMASRNRHLNIVVQAKVSSQPLIVVREALSQIPLRWANVRLSVRELDRTLFDGKPSYIGHKPRDIHLAELGLEEEDEITNPEEQPSEALIIEGEDFDGIRVFGDWELNQKNWYARMIRTWTDNAHYSGDIVAVAHPAAKGLPLKVAFPDPLPAGRYEVIVDSGYHRTRLDDNILRVTLGDQSHQFAWFLPPTSYSEPEKEGVNLGPIFLLDKAAATISITPLQFGGGCQSEIPALQERFIFIDRVTIQKLGALE
ncbi:MAG: hypothetical protein QF886_24175 [Planctomycetota bacterium]|nr:hypothetical protein [Planctomycetota bacterium]